MSQQKIMTAVQHHAAAGAGGGPTDESNAAGILAQASQWQQVARQARQRCQQGAEAEQELVRRRNGPGQ